MKFPLSWLKEYIDINLPPQQIAKILTHAGLEVDSIEPAAIGFNKVVVGRVTGVQKHPNADKLCVAAVTDGKEIYQVVCGAPNCRQGMKTALALVGASLPDECGKTFKVKKSKIRDVESFGMLCSGKELGIDDGHEGIMEFDERLQEGADVAEIYADTLFEVSLTPNLGHCMNLIGIARELSAASQQPVRMPLIYLKENSEEPIRKYANVSVFDAKRCPRYACRVVRGVKAGPSPDWMQKRLASCGLRSINNIVDITNYVLLEMGHPLHAFDYDKLAGGEIIVRAANEGERFVTLDGKERSLTNDDLLICDKALEWGRPVALAGVMGGENSEVGENTRNVLIESAYFHAGTIRRTSKRLGLQTDASKRFERGADPNNVLAALDRAAMLMQELAGGTVCEGVIDAKNQEFPELAVSCRLSRINQLLGTHLGLGEVENIFRRLGFHYRWDGQNVFHLKIPTYRADIAGEIDIIEEVARLYGYDNIDKATPRFQSSVLPHAPIFVFEKEVRARLLAEGLQEFLTCDLVGPTILNVVQGAMMPEEAVVKVLNPTSIEQSVLRTSLLPGLLQVVKFNWDHQNPDVSGFEIGRIHFKDGELYKEQSVAAIVMTGMVRPHHWDRKPGEVDFFDLKGVVENLLASYGIASPIFKNNHLQTFHSGRQAAIYVGSLEVGSLGEVHPAIVKRLDVPQRILFAEINLHDLYQMRKPQEKMRDIPIYPSSERDWTLPLSEDIAIQTVFEKIRSIPSRLLEEVVLLDIYQSDKLGKGIRNVTFHFVYRDRKKTVELDAVDAEHARIINEAMRLITKA